ncbi:MAG TPA: hypothetical protein DCQ26_07250 [Marinilabiliales bacterium]|nr:MAG: hypothetical protein A2437_18190 [Bacteroidetes bacterium RIFOXYC2_FULL_40_12]HAM98392.1 hypothetical protein [Marinilabiliales bacterium]HBY53872.1 hypothetical protein [Marinilabiliales bacterium]
MVQNLPGASSVPVVIGAIYDAADITTAMKILPSILLFGSLLFYLGSRFYVKDLQKVELVKLEVA